MPVAPTTSALGRFHTCTQDWFRQAFDAPTRVQSEAWPAILDRESTLLLAPTGSGKTLAAFMTAIDRLFFPSRDSHQDVAIPSDRAQPGVRVLYISPLKALGVDVDRNLRAPIAGLRAYAEKTQTGHVVPQVAVRSGDTSQRERNRILRHPPDILITTPESFYLMLTSKAESVLATVDTVIIDEIHALAATKRGTHLFLTLERLERLRRRAGHKTPLQRIGLSATQRPLDEIACLLGGGEGQSDPTVKVKPRPVSIIDASEKRRFDVTVEMPAEAQADLDTPVDNDSSPSTGARPPAIPSIWPAIHPRLVQLIRENRSTILFVNSRRLAERLATAINELAEEEVALAHHGSIAKETRAMIEDRLKRGNLPAMVATSSMELGIDMGNVDLVIQIEAPPSIASAIQRIGRAGHQVGAVSTGVVFPKYRGDLVACAAATGAMRDGWVEETHYPRNPLDILAQQIVAITSRTAVEIDELYALVRSAAPFFELPHDSFLGVLDLLAGRYPSDEFSELRPRINWDRVHGVISPRKGGQRLAILNGGTIPDRGLYGVYLIGDEGEGGTRVGELDEEMVFECRPGDVFLLGASSWRVMDITRDRVLVVPAPGEPGRMPFWKGDGPGRPSEFGHAIGQLTRELLAATPRDAVARLTKDHGLEEESAERLLSYLQEQRDATNELPTDQSIVVEAFLDEIGDWRVVILSPFGSRLHAPWGLLVAARLRKESGADVDLMWTDDGIVFRLPESYEVPSLELLLPDPDDVEDELVREIGGTALFAAKFRENAARSLLLPRRSPQKRTPLWLQRRRSADLLQVASRFGSFPILMETYRECMRDVFDMAGLVTLLGDIKSRAVRVHTVRTEQPSPYASSVLFSYVGNFIYNGDAPLAERRAQTLSLDHAQLRQLLGTVDFRDLLDPQIVEDVACELQRLTGWNLSHADDVHELLLSVGPQSADEICGRVTDSVDAREVAGQWLAELTESRRVFSFRLSVPGLGEIHHYAAAEDAARLRDAIGIMPPSGLADAFLEPVEAALIDLVSRFARTHGPFTAQEVANRLGLGVGPVMTALQTLLEQDRVINGAFRSDVRDQEWCDANVLRMIKRRSLAALRREVEPVDPPALTRFLADWHGLTRPRRGLDGILDAIEQLQGAPLPASTLEEEILPARVEGFRRTDLDELCVQGELIWRGIDSLGQSDGRIGIYLAEHYENLAPRMEPVDDPLADAVRRALGQSGGVFFDSIVAVVKEFPNDVLNVLWQLVWSGEVTNDTLTPLRSLRARNSGQRQTRSGRRSSPRFRSRRTAMLPGSEGRWSLLPDSHAAVSATERQVAIARQLVERHGILTRDMLVREAVAGGFSALYPVLKAMEESGSVRRGYFVAGLGGVQFAALGADDRLRGLRESDVESSTLVIAATDPANPWGGALSWPVTDEAARPQRTAGARVIVRNGLLLGYLNRTSAHLTTFLPEEGTADAGRPDALRHLVDAIARLATPGSSLQLARIDGQNSLDSPLADALMAAGFTRTGKGLLHKGMSGRV